jgi:hypothetical protein
MNHVVSQVTQEVKVRQQNFDDSINSDEILYSCIYSSYIHGIFASSGLQFRPLVPVIGFIPSREPVVEGLRLERSRRARLRGARLHPVGNVMIPTDEVHHFSEGLVAQPPYVCINHH